MNDFSSAELVEIIFLSRSAMDVQLQYWISVTFAVVVAAFVAGERLAPMLRYFVATLYVLASVALTTTYYTSVTTIRQARELLGESAAILPAIPHISGVSRLLLFVLGSAAAIYFLLRVRGGKELDSRSSPRSGNE